MKKKIWRSVIMMAIVLSAAYRIAVGWQVNARRQPGAEIALYAPSNTTSMMGDSC